MTEKYLGAYTPGKDDGIEYSYYPPFINFTRVGNLVRVILRGPEKERVVDMQTFPDTGDWVEAYFPLDKFEELLTLTQKNLKE